MNTNTTNEPSRVDITQRYFQVFRIGEKEIGELWATLECNEKNKVTADARCADYTERMFETKQGLVKFDNMNKRRIKVLTLWTKNKEIKDPEGQMSLYTEDRDSNVSIHLTGGDEAEIRKICESIKETLERSQPEYAMFIRTWGMIYVGITIVGIQIIEGLNWMVEFNPWGESPSEWSEETHKMYHFTLAVLLVIWVVWLGGKATKIWRRFFPIGCFQIGDELRREKTRQKWRWVAATLAIGAIISVIV